MSDKPKRPWFRFHLLTALLMMFVAATMIWLNCHVRIEPLEIGDGVSSVVPIGHAGWPAELYWKWGAGWPEHAGDHKWILSGIGIDAAVFVGVVLATALCSEFLLRRREGRKP